MFRILAELLGVNEKLLAADLRRLELASGNPSVDVRLTAEIITKIQMKTRELGLDPRDSTGRELYHALVNLVKLHDSFLAKRIGIKAADDTQQKLLKIRDAAMMVDMPRSAWVLKHSVAKRLLKQHPPKQTMKYLHYKSLDSMLKRESVTDLFAATTLLESHSWYESFVSSYKKLLPMDFEMRRLEIKVLDQKRWQLATTAFIAQHHHNILAIREVGAVLILPVSLPKRPGLTITLLSLILHHINEIRLYSAFYKLHQMQAHFGQTLANSLLHDSGNHVMLMGQNVHWRVVQRHFGRSNAHPEIMEPHVQPDDLHWRKAEEVLYRIEPALHFWHDLDYVATLQGNRPLSLNLMDMAINTLNDIAYEHRVYTHFHDGLWNELFERYLGQPALEAHVLKQLEQEATTPGFLTLIGST